MRSYDNTLFWFKKHYMVYNTNVDNFVFYYVWCWDILNKNIIKDNKNLN